ncbi:MAG: 16S rRNA (adenine(1518)-N(6)/adenine(1519)-N(6))-dimethyltransferase RsmA [Betaproteobacteria bacterium]
MGHRPRKRFGQHFLHDQGVLARIVEALQPGSGDAVVEIGPGAGALTRKLLEKVGTLTAIEIDRDLADALEAEFPKERLSLHRADVLAFDFNALPEGARIIGNLPYNISTPILFRLSENAGRFRDFHFMLQLEVVDRMVAAPSTPAYGRLSVMLQTRFAMSRLFKVGAGAFRPPPRVESAVVRMVPLQGVDLPLNFADVVRRAFSARRKTLRNALGLAPEQFVALGLDPGLRPENLAPQDYVRIARAIGAEGV